MRRHKLQSGLAGRSSMLLHLAVVLIFWQLVLWVTGQQTTVLSGRTTAGLSKVEHAVGRASPLFRSQPVDGRRYFFAGDQNRYYDPGLATVAMRLDPTSRYFVAMALEDCYAFSHTGFDRFRDDFVRRLNPDLSGSHWVDNWHRERAFNSGIRQCLAFQGAPILPGQILGLLQSAARDGDPRAIARIMLFRDLADSKAGSFDVVARLLSTGDPHVIRDVGLYLTRGESTLTLSGVAAPVPATTLAVAWELVACDFGLDCGGDSKLLNNLCAYQGQCGALSYEDWLNRYSESSEELSEILRVRVLLRHGLIAQDWQALGLSALNREITTE